MALPGSISASTYRYRLCRAVVATLAVVLALCATYGLFFGTCALLLVMGLAA